MTTEVTADTLGACKALDLEGVTYYVSSDTIGELLVYSGKVRHTIQKQVDTYLELLGDAFTKHADGTQGVYEVYEEGYNKIIDANYSLCGSIFPPEDLVFTKEYVDAFDWSTTLQDTFNTALHNIENK